MRYTMEDKNIDKLKDIPIIHLEHRTGVTVEDLIDKLQKIDDKSKFVAYPGWNESIGVNEVEEVDINGYAGSYSFQKTKVVLLT